MKQTIRPLPRIDTTVSLPGDKSISIRALILNSIANGTGHVSNLCAGDDRASVLRCLRGMGARIRRRSSCPVSRDGECFEVTGRGPDGLTEPSGVLNAGNSGTTIRLVSGLMASQPFFSVISGDSSLRSRPMARVVRPLTQMGAQIMGRGSDSLAPLAVRGGHLSGIDYRMPEASAQVKSSILIAGLHAEGKTTVDQPAESRDHTERMMRSMGADIEVDGLRVSLRPSELSAENIAVPGDTSAAAFWLVAACCHPNARIRLDGVGINPTRAQVITVLQAMGARIRLENVREAGLEPIADIVAESSRLEATELGGESIPHLIDELPVLAVAASFAEGTTVIADAGELRHKESDRIRSTVAGLTALGAQVEEQADGMAIHGTGRLTGGHANSYGDHRIAMVMAVAGLLAEGQTVVDGAEAAAVSYPGFWDTLSSLGQPARSSP